MFGHQQVSFCELHHPDSGAREDFSCYVKWHIQYVYDKVIGMCNEWATLLLVDSQAHFKRAWYPLIAHPLKFCLGTKLWLMLTWWHQFWWRNVQFLECFWACAIAMCFGRNFSKSQAEETFERCTPSFITSERRCVPNSDQETTLGHALRIPRQLSPYMSSSSSSSSSSRSTAVTGEGTATDEDEDRVLVQPPLHPSLVLPHYQDICRMW